MFAVIKTGGKQYIVEPDQIIKVEKLDGEEGGAIVFADVFMVGDDTSASVGTPIVDGASVEGEIVEQGRDRKKIVFRYHSKTRRRKKKGHRQHYTKVKITAIKSK